MGIWTGERFVKRFYTETIFTGLKSNVDSGSIVQYTVMIFKASSEMEVP